MQNQNPEPSELSSEGRSLEESLGEIARGQRSRAIQFCQRMLGDLHAAEDCIQEALLRMRARNLSPDESRGSLVGYFFRTLQRLVLDELARRKRAPGLEALDMTDEKAAGPLSMAVLAERAELVRRRLEALDERTRQAFLMKERDGKSYREIAEALNLGESHVGVLIHRARLELLEGWEERQ